MEAGMRQVFAEVGVPAECLQARFVNGFMYTRLRPLIGADKPPRRLPPSAVLRVATRLHPAFRARTRAAAVSLAEHPARQVAERWARELRPALAARTTALQAVPLDELSDDALGEHLGALLDHLRSSVELHFWLHGHDLGPIAQYLHRALGWGLDPGEALAALAGASPSTSAPVRTLVALREELERVGAEYATLDEVRAASPRASALLDEYLAGRGCLVVTGYDLTALTLAELPGLVLDGIRTAAEPPEPDHAAAAAALRTQVAPADRSTFDELLGVARAVMDMRDDNGPVTYEWPIGLLRLALLETGRRLVAQERLHDAVDVLDLTPSEAREPFGPGGPQPDVVAERVASRKASAAVEPPATLGEPEPQPPLAVLPGPLAEAVAMVQTALVHLDMAGFDRVDPLAGAGIGADVYRGRARIAADPEEAIDKLEPGDVLVVRATSPAFNTVLAIAGAVVTTHGGPLSHAAVIARELGLPAVIGAAGALGIPDGATVEVDPVAGRVRVVAEAPAAV